MKLIAKWRGDNGRGKSNGMGKNNNEKVTGCWRRVGRGRRWWFAASKATSFLPSFLPRSLPSSHLLRSILHQSAIDWQPIKVNSSQHKQDRIEIKREQEVRQIRTGGLGGGREREDCHLLSEHSLGRPMRHWAESMRPISTRRAKDEPIRRRTSR